MAGKKIQEQMKAMQNQIDAIVAALAQNQLMNESMLNYAKTVEKTLDVHEWKLDTLRDLMIATIKTLHNNNLFPEEMREKIIALIESINESEKNPNTESGDTGKIIQ